ncbi:CPBP family intramembrane glutamic endopeptidase [uncultured Jannaschia sp.]|uniref:CPBP family intramembrane glutamic endopeptidase n=1 Tax=uncultured Jannaschia sp. TaxID=293347 RepID=UPI0026366113|nr:CPBP family intramembrane glutamic endopeptidase [uncultured Jannaschia sp.]
MWTSPFESFVAPARARPQLWRIILGFVLAMLTWAVVYVVMIAGIAYVAKATSDPALAGPDGLPIWFADFTIGKTPTGVVATLATFAGMLLGTILAARWLHRRSAGSLFGAHMLPDFVAAGAITGGVGLVAIVILGAGELTLRPYTPVDLFLTFLPIVLVALLLQTGAEELLFRGYLQSQLAARFRSPIVWMLVPSVMFGSLHIDIGTLWGTGRLAPNDVLIFAATTLVGLITADLVRVTGSLGAAWGLHFVNNCQALLLISLDDVLSGLALYKLPFDGDDLEMLPFLILQDMVLLVIIWACIRLWLARRGRMAAA